MFMGYVFILYSVDHESFMHISAGSEKTSSALDAESTTLLKAVTWLKEKILSSVSIVSDCKVLVDNINRVSTSFSWPAENTLQETKIILKDLPRTQIKFIIRKHNSAVDYLAKEVRIKNLQHKSTKLQQKIQESNVFDNT